MTPDQVAQFEDVKLLTKHQIDANFGPLDDAAPVFDGSFDDGIDYTGSVIYYDTYAEFSDHHQG